VDVTSTISVSGSVSNIGSDPITIQGEAGFLNKTTDGKLLDLTNNSYVILGSGLTLNIANEPAALQWVVNVTGSTLDIKGADIKGHSISSAPHNSQGLAITGGSTVYLRTGTISGFSGVGVWLAEVTTNYFHMEGGTISHNYLRGVSMAGTSEFTMTGGAIEYNQDTVGGGVGLANSSKFTMYAPASITHNQAVLGGGVFLWHTSNFHMLSGDISNNVVTQGGGGVCINDGIFYMKDGTISGNKNSGATLALAGGGVSVGGGSFLMLGGTISNNLSKHGAGIWIDESGRAQLSDNARITDNKLYTGLGPVAGVEIYHPSAAQGAHFASQCYFIEGLGSSTTTTQLVAVRVYSDITSSGVVSKQRTNQLTWSSISANYLLTTNIIPGNWDSAP
jgi:hypothetical protein